MITKTCHRGLRTWLAAVLLGAMLAMVPAVAQAIPPGGASGDTPGTGVTVSPRTVSVGGSISYRVKGFPAGQVINIKIDDGRFCPQAGTHGACVVQQQRISASGTVTGSLQVPNDVKPGKHWLRFLASAPKIVDGKEVGTIGYTARGHSDFTVTAGSGSATTTTTSGSTSTTTTSQPQATASAPSAPTTLRAEPVAAAPAAPSPTPSTSAPVTAAAPMATAAPVAEQDDGFPVVGTVGLCLLVLLAGGLVLRARRVRA